ncbi:GntR family transcriptional regulator [Saccharothrix coeruleofusca]|uniref:GntR family transcriptional regulator n=1 Tax=Saccharothrix coeruleofusca TaxID=33919 RepID=A0A918AM91_9PSEU|nr:GntR family transcriptional regulator [Saccharothrix coeruleofusca]GGP55355.1 GntR family transcriptional regulator [Saccharothrix coeruleofusca]
MTPPRITVDPDSGLAPWRQVHDQITRAITAGALSPGTRLPPIRQLARDLGLAPGTVARVYRLLESEGRVTTAGTRGTVVSDAVVPADRGVLLREAADRFARAARDLGASDEEALAAVRAAWPTS